MESSILGAWKLRSFYMEVVDTKERSEPFGSAPRGSVILHPDGRMAALLTPGEAPTSNNEADQAPAVPKLIAYSGRFRLEPPDRLVTAVDVASVPHWFGTDQTRTYILDGDNLHLFTPPGPMPRPGADPVTVIGVLSWTREAATPVE